MCRLLPSLTEQGNGIAMILLPGGGHVWSPHTSAEAGMLVRCVSGLWDLALVNSLSSHTVISWHAHIIMACVFITYTPTLWPSCVPDGMSIAPGGGHVWSPHTSADDGRPI